MMTGDKNKVISESSELLNRSSIDIHEIEQQSNFHEIELKKISLDGTEEKRDSHDPEGNRKSCVTEEKINHSNSHNIGEKADSHEHEGKINSHEGDEPPEKGTITTRSPNAPIIKKKRGGWKLAILLLGIYC